jgi:hypothetical protein
MVPTKGGEMHCGVAVAVESPGVEAGWGLAIVTFS